MMRASLQALGRLPTGTMNKTEAAYDGFLRTLAACGDVAWWKFEGVKLRLADSTFYSPDFVVMRSTGQIECHEVKGARAIFQDDSRVKVKVAASLYPFRFIVAYPIPKTGGWRVEEVKCA